MLRFVTFFSLLFCLFLTPAFAADVNKGGEARLKTLFSKQIEKRRKNLEERGGSLTTKGDILIERADGYYALTLPSMTISDGNGMESDIGLIAINATPTDNPNNWTMSVAIPTPILYKDKDGKEVMRLDIGAQEMGGLWNGDLENFSKLSAKYSDIKFSHFNKQEVLTINKVMTATDLEQNKDGKWSGPAKINILDFKIAKPGGLTIIGLKEAAAIMEIKGFLPSAKQSLDEDSSDLPFMNLLQNIGESLSVQASIKGLILNSADIPLVKTKGLSFDSFDLAFSANDLQKEKITQVLKVNYTGLKTKDKEEDALLPDHATMNMNLANLPLKNILEVAGKIIPADQDNPAAKQVAALQAMITLPKIFSDAGTIMTLSESGYGNDIYSASLNGSVRADPKSPFGATGELIFGMDDIDATIKKLEEKENQKENLSKLKAIKEVCGKKEDKKNRQTLCRITLDESANLSVNDQDIKFLINALKGKATDTTPEDTTAPR